MDIVQFLRKSLNLSYYELENVFAFEIGHGPLELELVP